MPDDHRPEITQLTTAELDRYANQLTRCLKALDTRAPIRARVQHELVEVRAEQDTRIRTGQPAAQRIRRRRPDCRRVGADPARAGILVNYKALGETGNPEFRTVMRVVRALGDNARQPALSAGWMLRLRRPSARRH